MEELSTMSHKLCFHVDSLEAKYMDKDFEEHKKTI
jgi:hypothetical protein